MKTINKKVIQRIISFALILSLFMGLSLVVSAQTVMVRNSVELRNKLADPSVTTVIANVTFATEPSPITVTIPPGKTLIIRPFIRIDCMFRVTFVNNGTFIMERGAEINRIVPNGAVAVENNGTMENNGTIYGTLKNDGTYSGTGTVTGTITGSNVYAVTFDENYIGAPAAIPVNVYDTTVGVALMPADPTRTDYTFMGWNTAADGSGTAFDSTTPLNTLGSPAPTVYGLWVSQACDLTDFTLPNQEGQTTISGPKIGVTVPYGTDLTTLVPTITISDKATVSPASDTPTDFTNPVDYTVTAEDQVTLQVYTVTVTVGVQPTYAVTVVNGTGSNNYPLGATVDITAATPPAGQMFDKWVSSDVTFADENMADTSFTMPANAVSVTATYKAIPTYTVTVTNGTGSASYPEDAVVTITASTPPAEQMFDKWVSSDVTFANENMADTSFKMPAKAVSVTATYKAIPITPLAKHTITLGVSGNGTVSGGGSYDENTDITVIAKSNAGSSFVNWTENGVAVSPGASYKFTVTTARTLVANFKVDAVEPPVDPPVTPPTTTSYSGGSSDNYVGSNKADTSPNLRPSVTGRTFTKAEAIKLFNAALAAKPAGQTTLSFRANNYTKVDKTVLAELAALAQKNGVTLTVHFDTVVGKSVVYRLSVNPATLQADLDLTVKIVGTKLTLPKFAVPVEVAVQLPAGLTIETLKITQNGKNVTASAKTWLDKVGYLHFTTTGGEIVLGK